MTTPPLVYIYYYFSLKHLSLNSILLRLHLHFSLIFSSPSLSLLHISNENFPQSLVVIPNQLQVVKFWGCALFIFPCHSVLHHQPNHNIGGREKPLALIIALVPIKQFFFFTSLFFNPTLIFYFSQETKLFKELTMSLSRQPWQ